MTDDVVAEAFVRTSQAMGYGIGRDTRIVSPSDWRPASFAVPSRRLISRSIASLLDAHPKDSGSFAATYCQ
jgi:hypothetical protein